MCSVKILSYLFWIYVLSGVKLISTLNHTNHSEVTEIRQLKVAKNGTACILPQHPSSGSWSVFASNTSELSPGRLAPQGTILQISCRETYKLDGADVISCIDGGWTNGIGQCLKTCNPLYSTSKWTAICVFNDGQLKDCINATDGTLVRFKCAAFYEDKSLSLWAFCLKGKWSHLPKCVPVCGRRSLEETSLTIGVGSVDTKKGDYPWQVALYTANDKVLRCGGSLLNERVILTAAHCVTDNKGKLLPKERYIVAVGKYYREFNDTRDFGEAQFSEIHDMLIPKQYKGPTQNYFGDIAMIVAKKTFTLSARVQPVCVDWESKYESLFLNSSRLQHGYVTGWGYTLEYKNPSNVLQTLSVPLVEPDECSMNLPEEYQIYMTDDKICAGYFRSGISVCQGDSGGGLVFQYLGRYYIVGIASLASRAPTELGGCDSQQYGLYTQVSYYIDKFISHNEARYRPPISENEDGLNGACKDNFFSCNSRCSASIEQQCDGRVDCPDGSDENDCQKVRCPGYYFRCQYGGCINAELECDGKMDCKDGSDENTSKCKTNKSECDNTYQFRCNSGQCIDRLSMCDGRAQCDDNSDEIGETCKNVRCPRYKFRCKYGACVEARTECNGIVDCFDGSDEDPILCETKTTVIPTSSTAKTRE